MGSKRGNPLSKFGTVFVGLVLFALSIFLATALTGNFGNTNTSQTQTIATIRINKSGFVPATLSVKAGTRVVWINSDDALHQVASNPYPRDTGLPGLKSEILNKTQSYTYTADTTGTFGYHDQITPTINGTLVVSKR